MHTLLERQIKRALGMDAGAWTSLCERMRNRSEFSSDADAELAQALTHLPVLLERVSDAYAQQERDLALLRRSLELSSTELTEANLKLRADADASARALAALQSAFDATRADSDAHDDDGGGLVAMAEHVAALTREQERMRLALAQSEERFDLAMRGSNDGLWDYDLVRDSVYFSPRWIEMIGEAPQAVGSSPAEWSSRLHPGDMKQTVATLQAHLAGNTPLFESVFRFRHHDGHYLWMLSRGLAVRDASGKAVRIVGTHTDITQRVELERYLAQFKAAIDEHAIVSIADAAGTITYANQRFCDISGYSVDELLGNNHRLLKSGQHPDAFYREMWQVISAGHTWSGEVCNRARDGHHYWVLATISPMLDDTGKPYQYISIRADITSSKLHEAELRQAKEDAEAASKTKSEFLANMSHEIRTPMNGVLGMLNLALDTGLDGEQREYLDLAHSSANALLSILNDILDFSKIEAGRLDVVPEAMNPRALVSELARLNEARCREKGLGFTATVADDVPASIEADPVRVRQVLVNLFSNALKFTVRGEIAVEITRAADSLQFLVRDTGIGIPADKQAAVFEAFTQADGSITKRFGGTGLGLTISNRLVQLMGGQMGLRSEPGKGSEFFFMLPLGAGPEGAAPPLAAPDATAQPAPEISPCAGLDILLAEDNLINQKLAVSLLTRAGHRVTVVEEGGAAVLAVTKRTFDAVLMDMQMPGMDGLEATQRIRALPEPQCWVPIIALTANAYSEDQERCLAVGMNGFVAKPIRREVLLATLQAVLGGAC